MEMLVFLGVVVVILVIAQISGVINSRKMEQNLKIRFKNNYGKLSGKKYDGSQMDHVSGYYDNHKDEDSLDDITWNDLEMDEIFKRVNYCNSAAGEEYLYYSLRNPKGDPQELQKLEEKIQYMTDDQEKRLDLQLVFCKIGNPSKYSIYEYLKFLDNLGNRSNAAHFVMLALLVFSIVEMFVVSEIGIVLFFFVVIFNIISYYKSKNETDPYLATFSYIMRIVSYADMFEALKGSPFDSEIDQLKEDARKMKPFLRGSSLLMSPTRNQATGNPTDMIMDYFRIITHLDLIKFNQMYAEVVKNYDVIDRMITNVGKIETALSICLFRASLNNGYCLPEFVEEKSFDMQEGYHPLIDDPVKNSFSSTKGLLLTGSNASGKSTFLKTCAINAILGQAINTCLATSYKSSSFRIYSSMALRDDLEGQDSYYIVEIKSLKRVLDAAACEGKPVLCFIDEVLRGTNTVERIAASTQILKHFSEMNVLCFAATHDIELNELLEHNYDIYHFAGEVTDNDVHFDYLLHKGPATTRNAIKLLDIIGYDKNITKDAEQLAQKFITTGAWT